MKLEGYESKISVISGQLKNDIDSGKINNQGRLQYELTQLVARQFNSSDCQRDRDGDIVCIVQMPGYESCQEIGVVGRVPFGDVYIRLIEKGLTIKQGAEVR